MTIWDTLADANLAIWGAGREGLAAWSALRQRFPQKSFTILCPQNEEAQTKTRVDNFTTVIAGDITADILCRFDLVIKSAGISPYSPVAQEAKSRGLRFTSGIELWCTAHPEARVIAVTGTKGKSTTSAMIAHLLRAVGRNTALAGNIGLPVMELLNPLQLPQYWVLELSSFQTLDLPSPPEVGILLNLSPEHLDWHKSESQYYHDKCRLLNVDGHHPRVSIVSAICSYPTQCLPDSGLKTFGDSSGWHLHDSYICRGTQQVLSCADLPLQGEHNALNFCAALTAIDAIGENAAALAPHIKTFRGLPHRLQSLGSKNGIEYVNDSIATTPVATLAALHQYHSRTTLLVGGYDRGLDWSHFHDTIIKNPPQAIITMGSNGARIAALLKQSTALYSLVHEANTLPEAMAIAQRITASGDVVLLSPGAPSFGEFRDYTERGNRFVELAGFVANHTTINGLGIKDHND